MIRVGIDRGVICRRRRGNMGKHRQRNIKVVAGVRALVSTELMTHLRHAYRALACPEVRVRQRGISTDCSFYQRMPHLTLASRGRYHIGGRR